MILKKPLFSTKSIFRAEITARNLFVLVSIFSELLFAFVGRNLP